MATSTTRNSFKDDFFFEKAIRGCQSEMYFFPAPFSIEKNGFGVIFLSLLFEKTKHFLEEEEEDEKERMRKMKR